MATLKIKHEKGKYHDSECYKTLAKYIASPEKTSAGGVIGRSVIPSSAPVAMEAVAKAYYQEDGLKIRHSILSFSSEEHISPEQAKDIAWNTMAYYADDYQIMAAVHENTEHLHIHFLMSTVNYNDGSKYHGTRKDYYDFINHIKGVMQPYGATVVPVS